MLGPEQDVCTHQDIEAVGLWWSALDREDQSLRAQQSCAICSRNMQMQIERARQSGNIDFLEANGNAISNAYFSFIWMFNIFLIIASVLLSNDFLSNYAGLKGSLVISALISQECGGGYHLD